MVAPGVQRKDLVAGLKDAPCGSLDAEYVSRSPSGSVAEVVNVRGDPVFTAFEPIGFKTGAALLVAGPCWTTRVLSPAGIPMERIF
jgi:hypothetical protein